MTTIDPRDAELAELRATVASLTERLTSVEQKVDEPIVSDAPVSRRHALRAAGVLAAGAIAGGAGVLSSATPAAAVTGSYTSSDSAVPAVAAIASGTANSVRAWATDGLAIDAYSSNSGTGSRFENDGGGGVAIRALAYGSPSNSFAGGWAVWATGDVGYYTNSTSVGVLSAAPVQLELRPSGVSRPTTRVTAHWMGQIVFDQSGDLWLCVISGSPGTWRKLSGVTSAGAFHAVTPGRVHDSRVSRGGPGPMAANLGVGATGTARTISVANSIDPATGATSTVNFVPAGATAIAANVTVTNTVGTGYLAINPGGDTTAHASTINWFGAGQNIANGVVLTLNSSRQLTVLCGSGAAPSTNFIIDVTGYWM